MTDREERLERALWAIIDTFESAVAAHDQRGAGGQHVPDHGDFRNMTPSGVMQMKRWSRDLRDALRGRWPMVRSEWEKMFPSTDAKELDYMYRKREP